MTAGPLQSYLSWVDRKPVARWRYLVGAVLVYVAIFFGPMILLPVIPMLPGGEIGALVRNLLTFVGMLAIVVPMLWLVTGRPPTIGTRSWLGTMGDSGVMGAAGIETVVFGPGVLHDVAQLRGLVPPDESISIQELVASARIMTLAAAAELCA